MTVSSAKTALPYFLEIPNNPDSDDPTINIQRLTAPKPYTQNIHHLLGPIQST